MKKDQYGVFGCPINHSLSPAMHSAAFAALGMTDCEYKAYAVEPENLKREILKAQADGFVGLNLTIPLKEKIFETGLIIPDEFSKKAGAVNTLHFKDGEIYGYNTDAEGAFEALEDAGCVTDGKKILIVGAGGAAKSISLFFSERCNSVRIINRTVEKAQILAKEIREKTGNQNVFGSGFESGWNDLKNADVIIQTTELGMGKYKDVSVYDKLPLEENKTKSEMIQECLNGKTVFDVVYNPEETVFLKESQIAANVKTLNGVMMLIYQGALAFEIWTGKKPDVNVMKEAVLEALSKKRNE
ncbi:shikimate dehydrogenase [Methanimicrococcus blatticola]|uniref:Shikimate dehydrogenase (NADP(+)) n=1 Tax=Methanimicrococcus blatticola TaxID=91560 RepID=A0A484F238_9EURY|nr:shikimate dehydrogenase [Methanimicrococcus blatticola]MBZ3936339.1 shikimate dehydrogenase [Methanimicrococcus blatticola]MCC2509502.1 shikimate dehydrogenase [Methanimicrococcus blatticola]TDQ67553.1 shikimate dehydrogenase [Methanimicrococcus blatticola]